ncbi:MAG: tetratricopeptide repeat protein [Desulfobulbaceae bacterium]|nr:MAG: tetratricopeptide repeat protein [Desulfobulbaceae bacterium]
MSDNPFEIEKIESMLRKIPEREAPSGLCGHVMNTILDCDYSSDLFGKLKYWGERILWHHIPLIRGGAMTAMVAAAFWIGLEVGSQGGEEKTYFLSEEGKPLVFASKFHTIPLDDGTGLFEDRKTYFSPDFFPRSITLETPAQGKAGPATVNRATNSTEKALRNNQQSNSGATNSILFLLNLARNLSDSGNYPGALHQYEKILRINPQEQTALFNRAICLNRINDTKNEQQAFTGYLDHYRTDRWAIEAVAYLQEIGVFDYQVVIIGGRKIVVNQKVLLGSHAQARQQELERLMTYLSQYPSGELHLVVFCQDDLELGKTIATRLKRQIHALIGNNREIPVRISWFDEPALIRTAKGAQHELEKGLFLFTQPSAQQRSRI